MKTEEQYKPKVHFAGPICYMSGYGEHSRYILRFLLTQQDKYDLYLSPTNWAQSTFNMENLFTADEVTHINSLIEKTRVYAEKLKTKSALKFDLSLQVSIPTDWSREIADKVIGITAGIESDYMNSTWLGKMLEGADEVWIVSEHSKQAALQTIQVFKDQQKRLWGHAGEMPEDGSGLELISQTLKEKIKVFPFPVRKQNLSDVVDLLEDVSTTYNFLSVNQVGPRKNVEVLIQEFIQEFRDNPDVGLILKSHMKNHSIPDKYLCEKLLEHHIKSLSNGDYQCKIYLLHGNLTEDELRSLYTHPKVNCYASTTHGEGFGLPLYESACAGLPIAATGWSGHMDFLSLNNSKGYLFEKISYDLKPVGVKADGEFLLPAMKWAHPRPGSTAKALKSCYEKQKIKSRQAAKLQDLILNSERFNPDHIENKMLDRLEFYLSDITESYSTRKTENLLKTLEFEG